MQSLCGRFLTLTVNGYDPFRAFFVGRVNEYGQAIRNIAQYKVRAAADNYAGAFLCEPRNDVLLCKPQLVCVGLSVVGSARECGVVQAV